MHISYRPNCLMSTVFLYCVVTLYDIMPICRPSLLVLLVNFFQLNCFSINIVN